MNLIEQLGGYDAAKELRRYLFCYVDGEHYVEVDKALLEYRRQHNIFEVGDKVVFLDEPIIRIITDVFTIKRVDSDSLSTGLILSSRDYDGFGYQNQMRHATDDEIKVGHRL